MLAVIAAVVINSLQPVRTLTIEPHERGVVHYSYARDGQYEYLGTPRGLYRAPRIATSTLERIGFADTPISTLATEGETLYVGVGLTNYATWKPHSLYRTRDRGASFTPMDAGLIDCSLEPWGEPCARLVVRQVETGEGRIFVEAGGNVLVSGDDGATFHRLFPQRGGKPAAQSCPTVFTRVGQRMLFGGECPLDFGWLGAGTLRTDLLDWSSEPARFPLQLENRNVHFIRHVGGGVVYAAMEGALIKSADFGATWRFVMRYPLSGPNVPHYPYAYSFLVTPRVMLLGGFDKKDNTGFLAYSNDDGETWLDATDLVGDARVELLVEDADGRLLAGLNEGNRFTLAEIILGESVAKKRRAVRK